MKRERKVKVLETNIINVCGNKVTQVKQDIYERPFIIDYFPAPLHNLENCPSCKATHKEIFTRAVVHFINFPNKSKRES